MKKSAHKVETPAAGEATAGKSGAKARSRVSPRQATQAAKPQLPTAAGRAQVVAAVPRTKRARPPAAQAAEVKHSPAAQSRKVEQSPAMAKSKTAATAVAEAAAPQDIPAASGTAKRPAKAKSGPAQAEPPVKPEPETKSGMAAKAEVKTKPVTKAAVAIEPKAAKPAEAAKKASAAPPALAVVDADQPKAKIAPPLLKPVPKPAPLKVVEGSAEGPGFEVGDHVVYPTHGVGKITAIETQEIAGHILKVFVVQFEKDRMTLRVPVGKVRAAGLRRLSSRKEMDLALAKLRGRSRVKRTMWSRRAQEYEAKINSGDPASIAEVVRDLHRNAGQPDQSYSERQIYQAALDRLVRELAAVERIDEDQATQRLEKLLQAAA